MSEIDTLHHTCVFFLDTKSHLPNLKTELSKEQEIAAYLWLADESLDLNEDFLRDRLLNNDFQQLVDKDFQTRLWALFIYMVYQQTIKRPDSRPLVKADQACFNGNADEVRLNKLISLLRLFVNELNAQVYSACHLNNEPANKIDSL